MIARLAVGMLCLGLVACATGPMSPEDRQARRELGRILLEAGSRSNVPEQRTYTCTGPFVNGKCHGTLLYNGLPVE